MGLATSDRPIDQDINNVYTLNNLLPLILVTGVLDISSTGDGSTVCELTLLTGID